MKTFFNILQTVVNITNKKYPSDEFIKTERCNLLEYNTIQKQIKFLINDIYYKDKLKQTNNQISKFISLNSILDNSFFDNKLENCKLRLIGLDFILNSSQFVQLFQTSFISNESSFTKIYDSIFLERLI